MRRLLLFRHAKAVPATGRYDFERELVERGRRDAARIGAFVAAAGLIPDLVLHSGAARARRTAEFALAGWPREVETHVEPGLYDASCAAAQAIVRALPDASASVMLVGHNPSLGDLANVLAGHGARHDLLQLGAKFPTAGLAALEFEVDRWRDVEPASGKLVRFVTPDDPKLKTA